MDQLIQRHGEIEQIYKIEYSNNGFKYCIFVRGTESEMREYLNSEIGHVGKYHACSKNELHAANQLHLPVYIAPKL